MSDEKEQEKETPAESSPEEKKPESESVTEDVKKTDDKEPMIPKSRFDEVNDRMKNAEAQLASVKEQVVPKQEEKAPAKTDDVSKRLDAMEAAQSGHDSKVVEEAFIVAEGKGISLKEALETPSIKAYAEVVKSERAAEEATPEGGRSPKATPEKPLQEMTRDEHREHFKKLVNG